MPELTREAVQTLLPWYAANALNAEGTRQVDAWLAGPGADDEPLHAELTWLRLTAQHIQADALDNMPAANQGLETLMQRVRLESAAAAAPAGTAGPARPQAGTHSAAPASPSTPSEASKPSKPSKPSPWRAPWQWLRQASAARSLGLAGLALAQAAVIVVLLQRPMGDTDAGQTPLSDPRLPALANSALLQVSFKPTATESQMRTALQRAQASLVAGPGSLGIYTVAVPRAAADAAAAALRQQTGVVESVQVLPAR